MAVGKKPSRERTRSLAYTIGKRKIRKQNGAVLSMRHGAPRAKDKRVPGTEKKGIA